jgi:Ca-activated chloride channel family protein
MKSRALGLALLLAGVSAHGMTWSDLWSRPDQRTLQERQRAYDEIQAQEFAAAAKRLQPYTDSESRYNRGNALARAGDLQAALSAYDAALPSVSQGSALQRDARHNRELVEQQLKSQEKSDKSDQQSGKSDQQREKSKQQAGKSDQAAKGDTPQDTTNGGLSPNSPQNASQNSAREPPAERPPDQAKSANARPDQKPPAAVNGPPAGDAPERPQSEQALSLDQWLRWIPDDPAGLLRRKFMIEHMLKQREAQP